MLAHPTLDLLASLGLHGMAKGFQDLDAHPEARALERAEWLALLLEHEITPPPEALREPRPSRPAASSRQRKMARAERCKSAAPACVRRGVTPSARARAPGNGRRGASPPLLDADNRYDQRGANVRTASPQDPRLSGAEPKNSVHEGEVDEGKLGRRMALIPT